MRYSYAVFALLVSILLLPLKLYAWNETGHMVVAKIAYDRLKPDVRTKVDKMIADLSKEYPAITTFQESAPWPDMLRWQKIETFTHWHYIDVAISGDGTPTKNVMDTDNASWAISEIEPIVANNKSNAYERARFLAFLVHIVGDIHQPLHTVSRFSAAHPNGDEGGNLFLVQYPGIKHGVQTTKLHHVWDTGLGLLDIPATTENIDMLANKITKDYREDYFGTKINDLKQQDWIDEGVKNAAIVYNTPENQLPNTSYVENGKQLTEQRIALAGYRLAALLDHLLG